MEQQLAAGLCEGRIAELVENDEIQSGQMATISPTSFAPTGNRGPPPSALVSSL
jgi:hypothetical protein